MATPCYILLLWVRLSSKIPYINEIIWYLSSCVCLISFSFISSRFIHGLQKAKCPSFSGLNNIPFQVWTTCYPFICQQALQFSSVAQLCPTLCDPMNSSTPGLPVQLPEFTQTHVHWVSDAIQPSHPLLPLLLLPSIFPNIRVFSNESVHLFHGKRASLTDPVCYFVTKMRQAIGKTV